MSQSRFRDRMLIYFLTIIVLPVITLGVLGPLLFSREVSRQSDAHTREMVGRVKSNLETTIRDQEKLMDMLLVNPPVRDFFFSGPDSPSTVGLAPLLSSVTISHDEITGILLLSDDDRMFSGELERIKRDSLIDEDWYISAASSGRAFHLVTRPIGRNLKNASGIGSDEIVSIIKPVRAPGNGTFAGVLMVDLSLEYLEETLRGVRREENEDTGGFFCILDEEGDFAYAPVNPVVYRIDSGWFTDSGRIVEKTIKGRGYRFIFSESRYTGWKTVGVYYLDEALRPVRFVQFSALIIALITVVLSVLISMVYTSAVSRPVMRLQSVMEKAGHGDLTVRYDGHSRDEIDELGAGLNAMLERIQGLLDLVYREQQSKREAELRIMQQQIKPHFLYNTLDTILWMAEEDQPEQIVELVTALTKLFRIALSQGREIISLADEMEHVRSYLIIQKTRYEDKFDFRIDCPEDLHGYRVQKMILQPLVENAIYHGIKEKAGSGTIRVDVEARDCVLLMTVTDDGIGISAGTLGKINEGLAIRDHESDRTAFALYNVNDRIKLTYGDDFGLSVTSREGEGTTVSIRHPIIEDGR